jgi:catechol 2,3-dioxygenase-like lactoylglutathione lyase family enzyme
MRTDDVDAMTSFFRDVIGLEAAGEGETVTFQRLPTHRRDLVEVYAQEHGDVRLIPNDADVVIAFVVDDIRQAMEEVQAAGLELVGEPVWAAEAFGDPTFGEIRVVLRAGARRSRLRDRAGPRLTPGRLAAQETLPHTALQRDSRPVVL